MKKGGGECEAPTEKQNETSVKVQFYERGDSYIIETTDIYWALPTGQGFIVDSVDVF